MFGECGNEKMRGKVEGDDSWGAWGERGKVEGAGLGECDLVQRVEGKVGEGVAEEKIVCSVWGDKVVRLV